MYFPKPREKRPGMRLWTLKLSWETSTVQFNKENLGTLGIRGQYNLENMVSHYVRRIHVVAGHDRTLIIFSRIILVYYCKCCNLIGYFTRYLFGTKTALSSFACIQKRKTFLFHGWGFICEIIFRIQIKSLV
jgi:hypothetical protein